MVEKMPVENRQTLQYNKSVQNKRPILCYAWIALHHIVMMTVASLFEIATRQTAAVLFPSAAFPFVHAPAIMAILHRLLLKTAPLPYFFLFIYISISLPLCQTISYMETKKEEILEGL